MAFTIRLASASPLLFTREQAVSRESLPNGIISGMQAHRGSGGAFNVDLLGGTFIINGIVITDDADYNDLFSLPVPGGDEHTLLYVKYDPATDEETGPQYLTATGTYSVPAVIPGPDAPHSIPISDIWVPSGASGVIDAIINNREIIESNQSLTEWVSTQRWMRFSHFRVTVSGMSYVFHFDNMQLHGFAPKKPLDTGPLRFPTVSIDIESDTVSTVYFTSGWEIPHSSIGKGNLVYLYVVDPNDFTSRDPGALKVKLITQSSSVTPLETDASLAEIMGNDQDSPNSFNEIGLPGVDKYPYRPDLKNAVILAVLDTNHNTVTLRDGTIFKAGDLGVENGANLLYTQTLSSTAYGTGPSAPVAGVQDLDNVLDNAAVLHAATLDNVYDGFETGSADGAGRTALIDAGAMTLNNSGIDDDDPKDPWMAALRIQLDSLGTGDGDNHERALDLYTKTNNSPFNPAPKGERIGMSYRHPYLQEQWGFLFVDTPCNLLDSGTRIEIDFTDWSTTTGGSTDAVFEWLLGHDNQAHADSRFVTFSAGTGVDDALNKVYRLRVDEGAEVFWLESMDGLTNVDAARPGDFTLPITGATCTVWHMSARIEKNSLLEELEIVGDIVYTRGASPILSEEDQYLDSLIPEAVVSGLTLVDAGGTTVNVLTGVVRSALVPPTGASDGHANRLFTAPTVLGHDLSAVAGTYYVAWEPTTQSIVSFLTSALGSNPNAILLAIVENNGATLDSIVDMRDLLKDLERGLPLTVSTDGGRFTTLTGAIQALAVLPTARRKEIVLLDSYTLDTDVESEIVIGGQIRVRGAGKTRVQVAGSYAGNIFNLTSGSNIIFEDLHFTRVTASGGTIFGSSFTPGDVAFRNVSAEDNGVFRWDKIIDLSPVNKLVVRDCQFEATTACIEVSSTSADLYVLVSGCSFNGDLANHGRPLDLDIGFVSSIIQISDCKFGLGGDVLIGTAPVQLSNCYSEVLIDLQTSSNQIQVSNITWWMTNNPTSFCLRTNACRGTITGLNIENLGSDTAWNALNLDDNGGQNILTISDVRIRMDEGFGFSMSDMENCTIQGFSILSIGTSATRRAIIMSNCSKNVFQSGVMEGFPNAATIELLSGDANIFSGNILVQVGGGPANDGIIDGGTNTLHGEFRDV
jgi:hypothetical protein